MRLSHLALAALLAAPASLTAQQTGTARLGGVVTDSVHSTGAAGVMVLATRLSPQPSIFLSAVTDATGAYHLDNLPAGRYGLVISNSLLDSLDLALPPREVAVADGEVKRVDFGIPSGATLRAAACPGLTLAPGLGAVVGNVTDADTDKPLPGVVVAVSWGEVSLDSASRKVSTVTRNGGVRADSLGRYRLCGVPVDNYLMIQVQKGELLGTVVRTIAPPDVGVRVLNLSLSAAGARTEKDVAASDTGATLTGRATVAGTVRGLGGTPLADAQVQVRGAAGSARTDSLGKFTLGGLPAGTQELEVRRVGYLVGRVGVELRSDRTTSQDVQLQRIVSLDSIRVMAQRTRYREFEQNRRVSGGFGRYFTEEQIAKRQPFETSDLLRMVPGVRVVGSGFDAQVVSSRGAVSLTRANCPLNVVVDGMGGQDINLVNPNDIGAMEVYPGNAGAPPFYNQGCGVVVIWTKR